jgi:hypothetical protein
VLKGGESGGGSSRAADEASALKILWETYRGLYLKSGLTQKVAKELWFSTIRWVESGRRTKRRKRTREQLRADLEIIDTQEAAFKDALHTLRENLLILGFPRSSFGRIPIESTVNKAACVFEIEGQPHLVTLSGPTGRERGDGEHDALWLEPSFEVIREAAPVLRIGTFPLLAKVGYEFRQGSAFEQEEQFRSAQASAQDQCLAWINALEFSLNGATGVSRPLTMTWLEGTLRYSSKHWLEGKEGAAGSLRMQRESGRLEIVASGNIQVRPTTSEDPRILLTQTLDSWPLGMLDRIRVEFRRAISRSVAPFAIGDEFREMGYTILTVTSGACEFLFSPEIVGIVSHFQWPRQWEEFCVDFRRSSPAVELWPAIRNFNSDGLVNRILARSSGLGLDRRR